MRSFSLFLLLIIGLPALYQCMPIDESFGGFEPATVRRLLATDSAKGWQLLSRTEGGELVGAPEACEEDDRWIFVYAADTAGSFFRWSSDSVWCSTYMDTTIVDSTLTDTGWVNIPDTTITLREESLEYTWIVEDLDIGQITTDTVYISTDSTESLRTLYDMSSQYFSWFFYQTVNGEAIRVEETYEAIEIPRWPLSEE